MYGMSRRPSRKSTKRCRRTDGPDPALALALFFPVSRAQLTDSSSSKCSSSATPGASLALPEHFAAFSYLFARSVGPSSTQAARRAWLRRRRRWLAWQLASLSELARRLSPLLPESVDD
jgi:hypothetical protein